VRGHFRGARILKVVAVVAVAAAALGFGVMLLWNSLTVDLFGWHKISFFQAIGILILSRVLFGGFHGGGGRMHFRQRMMERYEKMTPEEREKFRQGMRCGHRPSAGPEAAV